MEQEMTVKELIALMNDCEDDFMIQIEIGGIVYEYIKKNRILR